MGRILQYNASGIQTHLVGLLKAISDVRCTHEIIVLVDPNQSLPEILTSSPIEVIGIRPPTGKVLGRLFWDHVAVGHTCQRQGIDALYAPAHVRPLFAPCPVVVVIYDMMYHRFPQYWGWSDRSYFRTAVSLLTPRAARIVATSRSTKQDILSLLPVDEQKVEVVYPGVPEGFKPVSDARSREVRDRYGLTKPFILFVGSFHPRKNLVGLLDAFDEIVDTIPHDLVIIGSRWGDKAVLERIQKGSLAPRVRLVGFVRRADLPLFYNEADVFVFPSLYEGFGFPVLEAMACGCPTITTDVSSLPEVAGDAAILVPPNTQQDLAQAIYETVTDKELQTQLREQAIAQARRFSWTSAARQTLKLLEQAAVQEA
jgi:glycosyltransferase involved in cell wall biosynthesis